jgi:feruloyl esterase
MLHGHSREAADQFDAMGALVDWVEQGKAPGTLAASTRRESVWPGRTRPLCVYPAQVTYTGAGSIEKASSFTCR